MSLELVKNEVLWEGTNVTVPTIASGSHLYFKTNNTLEIDSTNIPADTWFSVKPEPGVKELFVTFAAITTAAAGGNLTVADFRVQALGHLKGVGEQSVLWSVFPMIAADVPYTQTSGLGLTVAGAGGALATNMTSLGQAVALGSAGIFSVTGATPAIGSTHQWMFRLGAPMMAGAGGAGAGDFDISMFEEIKFSIKVVQSVSADITSATITGEMLALQYKDVQHTDKVDRRNPPRNDNLSVSIPAGE